jgi:hypothetical protein
MSRIPLFAALLVLCAFALAPASASARTEAPTATASKTCSVGDTRSYGTTYVTKITTRRVTCRKAKKVVRAFHKCRKGARGRCGRRVLRFRCSENRTFGAGSFYSNVVCKRGGKRVRHTYTQWT